MVVRHVAAALALAFTFSAAHSQTATHLLPLPAHATVNNGSFAISSTFQATVTTGDTPRLDAALARTMHRLGNITGLVFDTEKSTAPSLVIAVSGNAANDVDADESYKLDVSASGIRIAAKTDLGALHALETLIQLVDAKGAGYTLPSISINDSPRFRWRGLLIDCSRHFEPVDVLKRNIDAMAAVKLNIFHWHLMDDQGFRIESKRFPKLTQLGSDGQFYTQEQARDLVAYAHARGIRVVPEFEMPGHSSAWLMAYPELNSGTQPTSIRREFGVSPYVLDPTRDETYTFIESFLTEMTTIFPDPYVHIGGDEAPAPDWKINPRILAFMKAHNLHDNGALQAYFNQRVLKILSGLNKRMVGWDEILNPALPKDVVVQSWRGVKSLTLGAQQGYQGILSAGYYLDHMEPAGKLYLVDPVPVNTTLSPAQRSLILGGEVCMWAEFVDSRLLDSRVWPRAAAVAERLWSPQNDRDAADMYRRLDYVSLELEALGLTHVAHEDSALRALAGDVPLDELRTFANALEPASFSERAKTHQATTLTPLTQFVDALTPDPPIEHQLTQAAVVVSANPRGTDPATIASRELLRNFFATEAQAATSIAPELPKNASLASLDVRDRQLASLAKLGTDALRFLSAGPVPTAWKHDALAEIDAARKPSAQVHFDFLDALTTLINGIHAETP
jgi:hexosaminidase